MGRLGREARGARGVGAGGHAPDACSVSARRGYPPACTSLPHPPPCCPRRPQIFAGATYNLSLGACGALLTRMVAQEKLVFDGQMYRKK